MNVMVRVPATNPMTTRRCQVASDASDDEFFAVGSGMASTKVWRVGGSRV